MIRTKKVMKDLLRFKHDDMDGQDPCVLHSNLERLHNGKV